jgi:hypothetical protein
VNEVVPIASGLIAGGFLALAAPRLRFLLGLLAALVLGTGATVVTGEFQKGWEFLLVDIPLAGLCAAAGLLAARALRRRVLESRGRAASD